MPRRLVLVAVLLALPAGTARAATYCVQPESSCAGGSTFATLQAALAQAAGNAGADKVMLGAATYTAPTAAGFVVNDAANAIEIAGYRGTSVITAPAGATRVLDLNATAAGSSVHDVTVRLPASVPANAIGLEAEDTAVSDVTVDESPTQSAAHTGAHLQAGSSLDDATVTVDNTGTLNVYGVRASSSSVTITDTVVTARTAFGASDAATFDRVTAIARSGGFDLGNAGAIVRNCLVSVSGNGASGAYVGNAPGATITNCTFVAAEGNGGSGVSVAAFAGDSSATVANVVVSGFEEAAVRYADAGDTALLTIHHSDLDVTTITASGSGATSLGAGNAFHAVPGFADAATGDFRLRHDSPLVDAGDPATAAGMDRNGAARKVDGNGNGSQIVDVGEFEYQRIAPQGAVAGPTTGQTGQLLGWTASATDADPGDAAAATYSWTVDDGPPVAGATLGHTFTSPGLHTLRLTVTDPTGLTASAEHLVEVTAGPPAPAPSGGGGTTTAPPATTPAAATGCLKALRFRVRLDRRLRTATVRLAGKRLRAQRVKGRLVVRVDLRERAAGTYRLKVSGRTAKGRRLTSSRRLKVCPQ